MATARLKSSYISTCKFSPYSDGIVSCSTSESDQFIGPGTINIFRLHPADSKLNFEYSLAWSSAILDTCWSATQPDTIVGGCADNSIQIWKSNEKDREPIASLVTHTAPVSSVEWREKGKLVSSSLDGHYSLWDVERRLPVVNRNLGDLILQSSLCPFTRHIVASVLSGRKLVITDDRCPSDVASGVSSNEYQVLCCDWSPHYPSNILVSTSNGTIANVDLRRVSHIQNISQLQSHIGPARRARWLPAYNGLAVSVGFDGTTVISDVQNGSVIERIRHHSNIVYDVDCSPFHPGMLVDCSWDSLLHIFEPQSLTRKPLFTPFQNKL